MKKETYLVVSIDSAIFKQPEKFTLQVSSEKQEFKLASN